MAREMIITELNNKGYKAEAQNTIKNGVELEGIRIKNESNVSPIFYTEKFIEEAENENRTLGEVTSAIINAYEANKSFAFDVNSLANKDFILNNLYIGLQKSGTENIVKRSCHLEGIESYLYIRGNVDNDGSYSIKISSPILQMANIAEAEAWEKAEANTYAETSLESMAKVLADMMGMECTEEMEKQTPFYVISNTSKVKGASAILNKKALIEFGKRHRTNRIVVLPSSIHEMILVPYTEEVDINTFSSMVGEVNNSQVDPTERLTDRAYIINL